MSLPEPPITLDYPCTAVHDGKLYAYQSNAFQVLDLKEGGKWSKVPSGVPVDGATCVQGSVNGKSAFIVVGGSTSTPNYKGMQHFDFDAKRWTTDWPVDGVAVNRQHHGAAFLQQSSTVLLYAGSQDNASLPSTQTFLIHTKPPYEVEAFESSAPPVIYPLILSYNESHALMLGGDSNNKRLSLFSPQSGWQDMGVALKSGLKGSSKVQASIWTGSDGGKILEIFDMSVSPNQISTVLLKNATSTGKSHKMARSCFSTSRHPTRKRKRDTTLADRPAYNSTGAPQVDRDGFSLASDPNTGLLFATGGNKQSPLAIFNQTSNEWVNTSGFFGDEPSNTPTATSSSSPSSSASPTSTLPPSATSAPPAANKHVRDRSLTILGGVLGGVFGAAILLVLILVLLKLYKRRRDRMRERRKAEYDMDAKPDPLDFSDIGAKFMAQSGGLSPSPDPAHRRNKSDRSDRSIDPKAIDRNMTASSESRRALLHAKADSAGSGRSFWNRGKPSPEKMPPQISAPILGPPFARPFLPPESPRSEQREQSGWSRYFANNNSKEMLSTFPQPQQAQVVDPRPETYFSNSQSQSDYASSRIASSHPHESAEVEPLSFHPTHPPPTTAGITSPYASRSDLGLAITQGPSPERDRAQNGSTPSTPVSNLSESAEIHNYSHESEGHDSWSPIAASGERNSNWTDERTSSEIHNSRIYAHPGERVVIPNFPMPNSARNSAAPSPKVRSPTTERSDPMSQQPLQQQSSNSGLRNVLSKDLVRTKSGRLQATSDIRTGTQRVIPGVAPPSSALGSHAYASTSTARTQNMLQQQEGANFQVFPRPREQRGPRTRGGSQTEDMSWLNLGTSAEQRERDIYFPSR